jgi:hypothetical protein
MNATEYYIKNLPEEKLVWVVYTANMIGRAEQTIIHLRGKEYFDKYVTVVASHYTKEPFDASAFGKAKVYFDPYLHSLIGNGYN